MTITWPSAAATGARPGRDHLAEEALADPAHLAGAGALRAGDRLRARRRRPEPLQSSQATAVRTVTGRVAPNTACSNVEVGDDLEVLATRWPGRARGHRRSRTPPKKASKRSPRPPSRRIPPNGQPPTGGAGQPGLAEPVVARPLVRVGEHLVGAGHLLELLLGRAGRRVGVGVQLAAALAVGPLDLVGRGVAPDTPEQLVEVGHGRRP